MTVLNFNRLTSAATAAAATTAAEAKQRQQKLEEERQAEEELGNKQKLLGALRSSAKAEADALAKRLAEVQKEKAGSKEVLELQKTTSNIP